MSKILEMRQKRAEVWDKARAFLDERTNESGVMSAEDSQQYERMEQEVVDLGHTIDRMERAEQMEREMNEPVCQPLASRPEKRPGGRTGRATDEYKLAFWNMIRNRGEHFQVRNALQIGTDSEGGFLCPDEYERTLVQALTEENQLRSLCTIIRTESGDRKIPIVASHGTASWVEEEGQIPESDDAFGQISIGAHKVATMIKVSDELLQDSVFDVESLYRFRVRPPHRRGRGGRVHQRQRYGEAHRSASQCKRRGHRRNYSRCGDHGGRDHRPDSFCEVRPSQKGGLFAEDDSTVKNLRRLEGRQRSVSQAARSQGRSAGQAAQLSSGDLGLYA